MTQIVFTGPFDFSRDNLQALGAMADVLAIRLREVLREELGGTYGVQVQASGSSSPDPRYQLSIGFGADPERLEELTAVVFAQIDSLKLHGPRVEDMQKVREMKLRAREVELRQNHFWLQQLVAFERNGWDPREILLFPDRLAALDALAVQQSAILHLDPLNYVQVSLLPETEEETALPADGTELPSPEGVSRSSGYP